jgi:16S rRNA processing protein RimM
MVADFTFPEDYLLVAIITGPHGLKGDFKLQCFSDDTETMLGYPRLVLVDNQGHLSPALQVEKCRIQGKTVVLKLEGVDDRNQAEALHGKGILVRKADLPALAEDEYYWYQLVNLPVATADGQKLGVIDSIFSNGAQDIMVVKDGNTELLIPIVDSIIKEHTEKGVVITPPPGLLEIQRGADE